MTCFSTTLKFLLVLGFINLISAYPGRLTFPPEGKLTILQLTDLHYGEGEEKDHNNTVFQDTFIKKVKPDIVAATGDVASGHAYTNQTDFIKNIWKMFLKPIEEYKVPYLFAMGNHDPQGDLNSTQIYQLEKASEYSLCAGANEGSYENFNYYVPIYSAIEEDKVVVIMWIFDSHSEGCLKEPNSWGCVKPDQVEWYKNKSQELRTLYGDDVYHFGYVHIPLPEFTNLYNDYEFYGTKGEDVCCPLINTNLFEAIKEGGLKAIYSGHDHYNDYAGFVDGVELTYGRKSGYGGYGGDRNETLRGARVINLREYKDANGSIKVERTHYIEVENPEIADISEDNSNALKQIHKRVAGKKDTCNPFSFVPPPAPTTPNDDNDKSDNSDKDSVLVKVVIILLSILALGVFLFVTFKIIQKKRVIKKESRKLRNVVDDESIDNQE